MLPVLAQEGLPTADRMRPARVGLGIRIGGRRWRLPSGKYRAGRAIRGGLLDTWLKGASCIVCIIAARHLLHSFTLPGISPRKTPDKKSKDLSTFQGSAFKNKTGWAEAFLLLPTLKVKRHSSSGELRLTVYSPVSFSRRAARASSEAKVPAESSLSVE